MAKQFITTLGDMVIQKKLWHYQVIGQLKRKRMAYCLEQLQMHYRCKAVKRQMSNHYKRVLLHSWLRIASLRVDRQNRQVDAHRYQTTTSSYFQRLLAYGRGRRICKARKA